MADETTRTERAESIGSRLPRRRVLAGAGAVGVAAVALPTAALGATNRGTTAFTVRIRNVSDETGTTLDPSGPADGIPLVFSPGAYAVHRPGEPMFSDGEPERNNGLEEIAEDGDPSRMAASLAATRGVTESGAFTTPNGASSPGPLPPGETYEFGFEARRPARLSLVTMFVQSNDLFYALGGPDGLELFSGNDPLDGDVTDHVGLWDAGTEINEEPGSGENQAPRQGGAGVGLVERGTVASIEDVNGYSYPATSDVIRVTITPGMGAGSP